MHLFTYGSLMFEPVWSRVVRGSYVKRTARLHGFTRRKVRGDVYPVIFRSHDEAWVDGVVYLGVCDEDVRRLDLFEGDLYDRQSHTVIVEEAEKLFACAYILKETCIHMSDDLEWNPQWFATNGLPVFLGRYKGFH
jgi:gamma-glutamylcyclotransferase (GGCT)/AIG2-like uncharacterized protein YtfP